jgi:hypothetical protein
VAQSSNVGACLFAHVVHILDHLLSVNCEGQEKSVKIVTYYDMVCYHGVINHVRMTDGMALSTDFILILQCCT